VHFDHSSSRASEKQGSGCCADAVAAMLMRLCRRVPAYSWPIADALQLGRCCSAARQQALFETKPLLTAIISPRVQRLMIAEMIDVIVKVHLRVPSPGRGQGEFTV